MKGLLLKDVYELWGQAKAMLLLIVVYMFIGGASSALSSVAILLCAMLPTSCIGYDERAKWDRYARSMPVSVRDLVVSKYLLGYLALAVGVVIRSAVMLVLDGGDFAGLAFTAALALVYMALQLPILFKFGIESGRIWMMLLTAAFAMGAVALVPVLFDGVAGASGGMLLPVILLAAAAVLQVPSILISAKLYKTK